ncbi:hypothetical protein MKX03_020604 [Papaver bracteatum]|nr:hypothetical protein MKX03_020604 [Papaver bracteatum]
MSITKNAKLNLVHFISVLSFSLLILSVSAQKTNPGDVAGIKQLISTFAMLGYNESFAELPEDPCLPTPYPWVTCSSDDTPRVTALNLANNTLTGTVPTSLQKNKNLKLTLTGNKYLCFSDEKECKPTEEYIEGTVVNYPSGMAGTPGKNAGSPTNSLQIILGSVTSIFVMFWVVV